MVRYKLNSLPTNSGVQLPGPPQRAPLLLPRQDVCAGPGQLCGLDRLRGRDCAEVAPHVAARGEGREEVLWGR